LAIGFQRGVGTFRFKNDEFLIHDLITRAKPGMQLNAMEIILTRLEGIEKLQKDFELMHEKLDTLTKKVDTIANSLHTENHHLNKYESINCLIIKNSKADCQIVYYC